MKQKLTCFVIGVSMFVLMLAPAVKADDNDRPKTVEALMFMDISTVVSASFFCLSAQTAPGYTTIITQKDLEYTKARSLTEIIEMMVPGMAMGVSEFAGSIVGDRGLLLDTNAKTMLMYNGHELNHRSTFGYAGLEYNLPLLGDVQSLEVANGPNAIVHGSGAIDGFINILSKTGSDNPGLKLNTEYGTTEGIGKAEISYGKKYSEGKDLFVYLGCLAAPGFVGSNSVWDPQFDTRNSYLPSMGTSNNLTEFGGDAYHLLATGINVDKWLPSDKVSINYRGGNFKLTTIFTDVQRTYNSTFDNTLGGGLAFNAPYDTPYTHFGNVSVDPEYSLKFNDSDSLDFIATCALMDYYTSNPEILADNTRSLKRYGSRENHYELKALFKTCSLPSQQLAVGALYGMRNFDTAKTWWSGDLQANDQGIDGKWNETSVFAEDIIKPSEPLTVSLGLRYDLLNFGPLSTGNITANNYTQVPYNISTWGPYTPADASKVTKRIALVYEKDKDTTYRLSYQEGFRAPDANNYAWTLVWNSFLQHYGSGNIQVPLPKPESMDSYEFNFHKKFEEHKIITDFNAYFNQYQNTLEFHNFANNGTDPWLPGSAVAWIQNAYQPAWAPTQDGALGNGGIGWMGATMNAKNDFDSEGLEAIVNWQQGDNTNVIVSYNLSLPDSFSTGAASDTNLVTPAKWKDYPTGMVKATIMSSAMQKKITGAITAIWQSAGNFTTPVYSYNPATYGYSTLAGYDYAYVRDRYIVNIAADYKLTSDLTIGAAIKNLFGCDVPQVNSTYYAPYSGAMGQEKPFCYVNASYKFF